MTAGAGSGTDGREVILGRIRSALGDAPPRREIPRNYQRALPASTEIVELFVGRVEDYRATVRRTTPDALASAVAEVLGAWGARRIAVPAGVPRRWLSGSAVEAVGDDPPLAKAVLDGLDGVITGCAVAIAETGTIILDAGPDQGRRALSLLPDRHLCVVRVDQIVGSVPEALARLDPRRPLTWISGPSATSDIELQRVEGVHGPRHLHVLVVGSRDGTLA
jgi:L-lactate dehydrogenase complex protein LldG